MGNKKIITLIDGYREMGEAELICAFTVKDLLGKFVIYTKNEKDRDGNTIIYSGKVITVDNKQFIENIEDGEEWKKIKHILKSMSKYSLEGENNV